ncbi:Cytochrome P450 [Corchorus capsularis]|uniref:Cytochrome P450 n=1 Tax=Corchorus capsularis TaxID=210143 RepID=A0A1R3IY15_COCAP|nr:Cytochrome P450 [Corchorus capsularis]
MSVIGFGKRYEEQGTERSRFHGLLNESQALLASVCVSDYFPNSILGHWFDKFFGFLSRLEKNFQEFDKFYQELIDEHLDPNRAKPEQEDIIDVLLQLWKDRDLKVDLTLDHIKGVLMVNFFT